jgi:glycosyltransferase involved in cell wall biosynthesis
MAAGLPVVASGIGQIRELILDGSSGLLYPPGDESALADCLCWLAADPELRRRLGREARRRAVTRHSWDSVAARVLALAVRQSARFVEVAAS